MSNTVAQIRELLATLPEKQRAQVMAQVNWSSVNFMTITEDQAKTLLARITATIPKKTTNPIGEELSNRAENYYTKANEWYKLAETKKDLYSTMMANLPKKDDKNYGLQKFEAEWALIQYFMYREHGLDAQKMGNHTYSCAEIANNNSYWG